MRTDRRAQRTSPPLSMVGSTRPRGSSPLPGRPRPRQRQPTLRQGHPAPRL